MMFTTFLMSALLIIDVQNDFLPNGSLAVPRGDEILPVIEELVALPFTLIVASKDYHPAGHASFASTHQRKVGEMIPLNSTLQIMWPDHCVQGTTGSDFPVTFPKDRIEHIVYKGVDLLVDSYSAFFDNAKLRSTGLDEDLKLRGIDHLVVVGLATDFCVLWSVLDALSLGYQVDVIKDGCRGIDLHPGDVDLAYIKMEEAGANLFQTVDDYRLSRSSRS